MGLLKRRIYRAISAAKLLLLRRGVLPSIDKIIHMVKGEGPADSPIMKVAVQKPKKPFDMDAHNKMLVGANEDFKLLFDEFYAQSLRSLRVLDSGDIRLRRALREGRVTNDLLEHELLRVKGIDGYFFGNYDTFRDISKVDLDTTTARIDLGTESVRLPRSTGGTIRVRMDHLVSLSVGPVSITEASSHVVSSKNVSGQPFSNMFDSLSSAWQYEVLSTRSNGIIVSFDIPVTGDGGAAEVSTVVIDPLTVGFVPTEVSCSTDGQNYTRLSETGSRQLASMKVRYSGTTTLCKKLRFRFSVERPVREETLNGSPLYTYMLGIKEIEVYKESFVASAILQSVSLSPISAYTISTIDKVALDVEEEVPEGTEIRYEVAPDTDPTNFRKISPVNRPRFGAPTVIDFDQIVEIPALSNIVDITSSTVHTFSNGDTTRNGLVFYQGYTFATAPQFMSVTVRRGLDAWRLLQKEGATRILSERGNLISFSDTDNSQRLYVSVYGEHITTHPASTGTAYTSISPRFELISDPNFAPASTSQNPQNPASVVSSILLIPSPGGSGLSFSGNNAYLRVGTLREGLEGEKLLVFSSGIGFPIRRIEGQSIYLDYNDKQGSSITGNFRVKQLLINGTVVTVVLEDPAGVLQESGSTLAGYFSSLNVAEDVIETTSSEIRLSQDIAVRRGDTFVVDYRRRLLSSEKLIPSSVVVFSSIGDQHQFRQDTDYAVDAALRSITRLADGSITMNPDGNRTTVRVNFSYESRDTSKYIYETVVTTPSGKTTTIDIDNSALSLEEGESISLLTSSGVIDLSTDVSLRLSPGLHRVRVVSKPARTNSVGLSQDTAFYKAVNLVDVQGQYIFSPGRYFESMEAYSAPLQETSLFRLTTSIRREDTGYFAVDGSTLVFNNDPFSVQSGVITILPGGSVPLAKERMAIGYKYLPSGTDPITGVILRATLNRKTGSREEVTPTIYGYNVRFTHGT